MHGAAWRMAQGAITSESDVSVRNASRFSISSLLSMIWLNE